MRYKTFTYLLGAMDFEMSLIETTLKKLGCIVVHVTTDGFAQVRSSDAYAAIEEPSVTTVWIECAPKKGKESISNGGGVLIDHHHEGDPGYEAGPSGYMAASSIGQLLYFLVRNGWVPPWTKVDGLGNDGFVVKNNKVYLTYNGKSYEVPNDYKMAAAADHCLAAAYASKCPGVLSDELYVWRLGRIAAFTKKHVIELVREINATKAEIMKGRKFHIGNFEVVDLRDCELKMFKDAAAQMNVPVMTSKIYLSGVEKVMIQATNPDIIKAFMTDWGPKMNLIDIYGNPNRGIAGGFNRRNVDGS